MSNIGVKLAIRLAVDRDTIGSGFYIPLPKHDYDLIGTAKHCLCNKDPEHCRVRNPYVCDKCDSYELRMPIFKSDYLTEQSILAIGQPIFMTNRDVVFIKVVKLNDIDDTQIVHSEAINEELYAYGFPSGNNGEGTSVFFNKSIAENDSRLALTINTNAVSNADCQQNNLSGLSGSAIYTESDHIVGIYTGTQAFGNGIAVKFDKHIISFLNDHDVNCANTLFDSFQPYHEDAFIGFEQIESDCKEKASYIIDNVTPQMVVDEIGLRIMHSTKFDTINELIDYIEQKRSLNNKLWKGWLQLLTYFKILQIELNDISNLKIKVKIKKDKYLSFINRSQDIDLDIKLYFTEKGYFETANDYIKDRLSKSVSVDSCIIFHSDQDNFGRRPFPTKRNIKSNISGDNTIVIPQKIIGVISLSQLTDTVIKSDNLNQVRIELKNCLQDAIK